MQGGQGNVGTVSNPGHMDHVGHNIRGGWDSGDKHNIHNGDVFFYVGGQQLSALPSSTNTTAAQGRKIPVPVPKDHENLDAEASNLKPLIPEEDTGNTVKDVPAASRFTLSAEAADELMLHSVLDVVQDGLDLEDVKKMSRRLPDCRGKELQDANELFQVMRDKRLLSPYDVIYLQAALWAIGKDGLFKEVAEKVEETNQLCEKKVLYLDVTSLKPRNGFKYVEFYVNIPDESISEELKTLKKRLVQVLRVDKDYIKYINIVSGKPVQSILVVMAMPSFVSQHFLDHFYHPDIQQMLLDLHVEYVVFHHNCELSVHSSTSANEGVQSKDALVTSSCETERPHHLLIPAPELSSSRDRGNVDKSEEDARSPTDEKAQLDNGEMRLLNSVKAFYKSGTVYTLPGMKEARPFLGSPSSGCTIKTGQTVLTPEGHGSKMDTPSRSESENSPSETWHPSHPDADLQRVMERLKDQLQRETAPGDPPAFLLCDPRLASLAVPGTELLLVLHWRLGVLLVAVGKGEDLARTAAVLRKARLCLLQELQGLVFEQAVTLAIALPWRQPAPSGDEVSAQMEGDVELLLGSVDSNYGELVTKLRQRSESLPAFQGSTVEERQRSFKLAFVRHCKIAQTTPSSTPWLLPSPEQLSVLCSVDHVVTVVGPSSSGKTTVLVELARLWLKQGHCVAVVARDFTQCDLLEKAIKQGATASPGQLVLCISIYYLIEKNLGCFVILDDANTKVSISHMAGSFQRIVTARKQNTWRQDEDELSGATTASIFLNCSFSIPNNLLPWINRMRDKDRDLELEALPTAFDEEKQMEPVLICHIDHTKEEPWGGCSECSTRLHDALSKFGLPMTGQSPGKVDFGEAVAVVLENKAYDSLDIVTEFLRSMGLPAENQATGSMKTATAAEMCAQNPKSVEWSMQQSSSTQPETGKEVLPVYPDFEFNHQKHTLALLVLSDSFKRFTDWEDVRGRVYEALCKCRGHVIVLAREETPVITLLSGASSTLQTSPNKEAIRRHQNLQAKKRQGQYKQEATKRCEEDSDRDRHLKTLDALYQSGRVFCFPNNEKSTHRPPRSRLSLFSSYSMPGWALDEKEHPRFPPKSSSSEICEPSHPDMDIQRAMQLLKKQLQRETAPGDPPAFLLCDPRLASLAVPGTDLLLVLHWRLGVLLVAVEKGEDLAGTAAVLREARLCLLQELQGLVSDQAVTLAIALPRQQSASSGDEASAEQEEDVELLLGSEDSNYEELVSKLRQRRESLPAFQGSTVEERQRSFKLAFVRHCKTAQTTPSSTQWLLPTPEQLSALCSADPVVTVVGPPSSGKTTVLVEQARLWLKQGHQVAVVAEDSTHRDRLQKAIQQGATANPGQLVSISSINNLESSRLSHLHVIMDDTAGEIFHQRFFLYEFGRSSFQKIVIARNQNTRRQVEHDLSGDGEAIIFLTRLFNTSNNLLPWINRMRDNNMYPELEAVPTDSDEEKQMEPVLICHSDHTEEEPWEDCSECSTRLHDALSKSGLPVTGQSPGKVDYSKAVAVVFGNRGDDSSDNVVKCLKSMGLPAEKQTTSSMKVTYAAEMQARHARNAEWSTQQSISTQPETGKEVLPVYPDFEFKDQKHSFALLVLSDSSHPPTGWQDVRQRVYEALCKCRGHVIVLACEETPVISLLSGASSTLQEAIRRYEKGLRRQKALQLEKWLGDNFGFTQTVSSLTSDQSTKLEEEPLDCFPRSLSRRVFSLPKTPASDPDPFSPYDKMRLTSSFEASPISQDCFPRSLSRRVFSLPETPASDPDPSSPYDKMRLTSSLEPSSVSQDCVQPSASLLGLSLPKTPASDPVPSATSDKMRLTSSLEASSVSQMKRKVPSYASGSPVDDPSSNK